VHHAAGRRLRLINFHPVNIALDPFILIQQFVFALALDVNTAFVRHFVLVDDAVLGALDALHLRVLVYGVLLLAVALDRFRLLLLGELLRAVLFLVGDEVGFGLLGREFSGC